MARMTQSTMNSLLALAIGSHNLAFCQKKKYQLPFGKSGFRPFRKWSCGEPNVIQFGTLRSQISSVRSLSLSTVANCRIGHREQEYCQSSTIRGLKKRGYCVTKCANNHFQGRLRKKYKSAVKRGNNSKHDQSGGKRKGSPNDSDEPDPKRQNLGGKSDMDESEAADLLPQNTENQQLSVWIDGETQSNSDLAVNVNLEMKGDGEHVLKIKRVTPSSTEEDKVERAKQMAQKAAMLLLYGKMLLDMGNKLHAQSQESLPNE
ncbi:hypothetical protein E2542_SST13357 [Spatholobus suberectus]|nr:hypothetical protein E2542_SST13357 [Spatholobus suberectus]